MRYNLKFAEALHKTDIGLDGIIEALGGEPPVPPPNPKTVVTYSNGDIVEYEITGELESDSIPNKTNAVKIEIGNIVTSIGVSAFYECNSLSSIIIPTNVTSIGTYAFYDCDSLSSITIPTGVTDIENSTFRSCNNLTSIIIMSNNMLRIYDRAFYSCNRLSSIKLMTINAPTVDSYAFGGLASFSYTGRDTYNTGDNVLKVPQGATGYETTGKAWKDTLLDSTKCGFHIVYE